MKINKYYYIYTFGCKVNQYESQLISENLKKNNFKRTWQVEKANLIIINSCTVTEQADKKCICLLKKLTKTFHQAKIILTGCLSQNNNIHFKTLFNNVNIITDKTKLFNTFTISSFDAHSRAFVKIQDGCTNFCSYCIIPYIRNVLYSKNQETVVSEVKNLLAHGYCEIVLTGINIGKYKYGLSNLLEKLVNIPMDFRVRISSIELNALNNTIAKIMLNYPTKICRHLHIPLQSGSNDILKAMNRQYSTKDFIVRINSIFNKIPDLTLTTDIITGFPGETNQHHNETCNFIDNIKFAKLNIFKYSDRHITQASLFPNKVNTDSINKRAKELMALNIIKKARFIKYNIGLTRSAVQIGNNKALTDNYIITDMAQSHSTTSGIFNVVIKNTSTI
ncbi:MAG: radical SAM protein [Endomicrobium sp.]|jgi:threonylcarbamoyladenosine tRNA methylthiotransferase MtaB|nr:radical SAM protein [Endomicrobium sp.]